MKLFRSSLPFLNRVYYMFQDSNKFLLIAIALLTVMVILSRDIFFIVLDAAFAIAFLLSSKKISLRSLPSLAHREVLPKEVEIKQGTYKGNGKVKGVLVVDDIPFDYRDLSDESLRTKIVAFHKALDVLGNVEIIFKKEAIDKNEFLDKLFSKAQNLRVIVEADPSNEKAKNEYEMVQAMIKKINEGETPFRYVVFFLVEAETEENARASLQLLKKGLESIGVKSRLASQSEIRSLLEDKIKTRSQGFPSQVPFLTVFSLPKSPKFEFFEDGIYLGKEIGTNTAVFWNYPKMLNPHVLLIGPTGAGKTEFLISLAYKVNLFSSIPIVFFDTKSDIKLRLKKYGIKFKILNPLIYSLGLLNPGGVNIDSYISQLESILQYSFQLDRYTSSILYKVLNNIYRKYKETLKEKDLPTWDNAIQEIESLDLPLQMRAFLFRVISQVKEFDKGVLDIVNMINDSNIYVVDLSLIKSEELRRLIMLSTLTKIYNKYNVADDKLKIGLVVDEAWTVLKDTDEYSIIADIIKRGRGFGVMLLMATQNIIDLGQYADIYLQNIGLIAFMNAGDKKFWQEVTRFVNIPDDEIKNELSFLGRGEALVRFITDPRPVLVSLDSFAK